VEITTSPVYAAALNYARHGWAVIPVHGLIASLPEKHCTCNRFPCGPGNANAGKHPVRGGWTTGPPMSAADIYAAWVEEGPDWNVGIRTGDPSGFFGLDTDPKAGGHHELARLEAIHGQLPVTRTIRTGSGGRHYYFQMPDFPIRNNARKIAPGIDIRGTGGMIVGPPSVSAIGPYDLVTDAPIVTAPAWLLDMLRLPEGFDPGETVVVEDLPAYLDLDADTQHRVSRYALSVLEAEARTYAEAPPGTGNAQLFRSTCNMLEIVQSPWNQLTADDVVRMLDRAREQRTVMRPDGGQGPDEFRKTVQSARSKVVGTGRQLPPEPANGVLFDHVPLAGPVVGADVTTGVAELETVSLKPRASALERLRGRLHTRSQLRDIRPPTPLIDGVLDVGTMIVLAGQFGTFKTFATVGWACSIATGTPWLGHKVVTPGPVLYVAAEGASGIQKRVDAWERRSGVTVPDDRLTTLDVPVNLGADDQASALLTIAKELGAVLVIVDTLHRCTPGLDGDDNSDMGRITMVADALREHVGAATLYVHHTGHAGTRSRGASAIEDDADAVWIAKLTGDDSRRPDKPRQLEQRKTKDSDLLEPFFVKLDLINEADSGVLIAVDESGEPVIGTPAGVEQFMGTRPVVDTAAIAARLDEEKNENAKLLIQIFADTFAEHSRGVTEAKVKAVARDRYNGLPGWSGGSFRTTFDRAWGRLQARGVIEITDGERWQIVPVEDRIPGP
jgi:hypothetical protein